MGKNQQWEYQLMYRPELDRQINDYVFNWKQELALNQLGQYELAGKSSLAIMVPYSYQNRSELFVQITASTDSTLSDQTSLESQEFVQPELVGLALQDREVLQQHMGLGVISTNFC